MATSTAILTNSVTSSTHLASMAAMQIKSLANPFLLQTGRQQRT